MALSIAGEIAVAKSYCCDQSASLAWDTSFEGLWKLWPSVLSCCHSLTIIQACFAAIPDGESAEKRGQMVKRANEIMSEAAADASNGRCPRPLPPHQLLKDAIKRLSKSESEEVLGSS